MKRKDFLKNSALMAAGLSLYAGCSDNPVDPTLVDNEPPFPYLEISAPSNYDIGYQISSHFKTIMTEFYKRMIENKIHAPSSPFDGMGMLEIFLNLIDSDRSIYYDPFLTAARNKYPEYIEELEGFSAGSDIPFKSIFAMNCQLEILNRYISLNSAQHSDFLFKRPRNCSAVSYSGRNKHFLAHNFDFDTAYADLLFCAKISQPGKPTYLGLNFPTGGLGVGPWMNEAGMVFSPNQLDINTPSNDVPTVLLLRNLIETQNMAEAKEIISHPNISYAIHINLGSMNENKIISAEIIPGKYEIHEVQDFYVHTNHFILPTMEGSGYIDDNSITRRNTLLSKASQYLNNESEINNELFTEWMSSHEGYPNAVCVHSTACLTVSHSVFNFEEKTWKLYKGNPCANAYKTLKL